MEIWDGENYDEPSNFHRQTHVYIQAGDAPNQNLTKLQGDRQSRFPKHIEWYCPKLVYTPTYSPAFDKENDKASDSGVQYIPPFWTNTLVHPNMAPSDTMALLPARP